MNHGNPKERLEGLIASRGVPLALLTPEAGLELMIRAFVDDPADGRLTCEWTSVTRYGDEEVGIDITRWFDPPSDRPPTTTPISLSLMFKVGPWETAGDFPVFRETCREPAGLSAFRAAIEGSAAFEAWGRCSTAGVALVYEDYANSGKRHYDLFDEWGARDPSRPIVSMTEEEWLRSDDVSLMLRWYRQEWRGEEADLDRLLHRYCLACCRRIWRLLPQEESRAGVEVAERFLDGRATMEELSRADWLAEGAAFVFEFDTLPEAVARWCDEVSRIPPEGLAAMIRPPRPGDDPSPRGLLKHAAYFVACAAIYYPGTRPKESIEKYIRFLPAPLLREVAGNPFRPTPDRPSALRR